jgi:MYXO-CTERM domain-containing protein
MTLPSSRLRSALAPASPLLLFVALSACGAAPDDGTPNDAAIGSTSEAIVSGSDSDASQNAVVLLIHSFTGGFEACSGTMLAPQLVLTARHCLAKTSTAVQCSPSGATVQGNVSTDFDPSSVLVFGGVNRPQTQAAVDQASQGKKTFDDGSGTLCNHDVALLLLDKPVIGANIAPIRLDSVAPVGETMTIVGWGETTTQSLPPIRQQRPGVKVIASGVTDGVGSTEFVLGEGSCEGDSGGPAFAATGAVVGVSSRGGNDTNASGAAGCVNAVNIYTAPLGFKSMILQAYQEAGQQPWLEGQPNPNLAAEGAACSANQDCQSSSCSPTTHTCLAAGTTTTTVTHGCAAGAPSSRSGSTELGLLLGLAAAIGAARRRRR